jgi:protein-tyrosine phosphatase
MELLFVCHANLCRSPMAERYTRLSLQRAGLADGFTVGSAGTHALPGNPMHPVAAGVLAEYGAAVESFRTRELDAALLRRAGLVLTAGPAQRAACVREHPGGLRHTFTLRQFGRLAAAVDPALLPVAPPARRLAALLAEIPRVRAQVPAGEPADDEVRDPLGGTVAEMRASLDQIAAALRPVLELIAVP